MVSRDDPADLAGAYAYCLTLARQHYENFPVASRLLPSALRPHVAAIYAFARTADDFADEPGRSAEERLRLLAAWRARLAAGGASSASRTAQDADFESVGTSGTRIFLALEDTIARFDLPRALLDDLLSAFSQDVTTALYGTWDDVLDYCRRSANPVGRLVLRLTRQNTPALDRASDAVCTALQLTNFWQDFAVDWQRGRLYLPAEEWQRHHADLSALKGHTVTREWRAALAAAAERTQALFHQGRRVCHGVSGPLRYELRATWLGGMRILAALERSNFDVFAHRPTLRFSDKLVVGFQTLVWNDRESSA